MVIGGSKKKPSFPKILLLFQIIEITEAQKIHQNPISIFLRFNYDRAVFQCAQLGETWPRFFNRQYLARRLQKRMSCRFSFVLTFSFCTYSPPDQGNEKINYKSTYGGINNLVKWRIERDWLAELLDFSRAFLTHLPHKWDFPVLGKAHSVCSFT